jgi:hypothetical protein
MSYTRQQKRYDATKQIIEKVVGEHVLPGETLQAWSFAQGIPAVSGRIIFGASIALFIRPYILAVTNQRVFLVRLAMIGNYRAAEVHIFPLAKVRVSKVKQHLIVRWAKSAYVTTPDGPYRFDYFPFRSWARLDPVLEYIRSHSK